MGNLNSCINPWVYLAFYYQQVKAVLTRRPGSGKLSRSDCNFESTTGQFTRRGYTGARSHFVVHELKQPQDEELQHKVSGVSVGNNIVDDTVALK